MNNDGNYIIVGGAGFVGSHFIDRLLASNAVGGLTIYDNFSSGRECHFEEHKNDARLRVVRADVKDLENLKHAMEGNKTVIHLASNPDIAKAATQPDVDFWEGTYLTHNVLEAMRVTGTQEILYASGSGVYGDLGSFELDEDYGPMVPISTYGASKLAGEALITSYCHMFGLVGRAFRFGNIVGSRQTHGVAFDFIRRLRRNPRKLEIRGDGAQSKSYIHVDDVVYAVLLAHEKEERPYRVFNVASGDYITVKEIAQIVTELMGLDRERVEVVYTGGDRGWKGDVPIVRINQDRIRKLGWNPRYSSSAAMAESVNSMLADPNMNTVE